MNLDEIKALDQAHYMNTFGERTPLAFTHGKGCTLFDTQGKAYTDFLAGIAVNCLGYGDTGLAKAINEQAKKLIHCSNIFYIEQQAQLAAKLSALSGGYKVFVCNSGAEANEAAFKLARKYFFAQGKDKCEIISAKNSFHGRTLATIAATGQEKYQKPFAPLPAGFINVEFNNLTAMEEAITEHTAAIIVETIQGEGGVLLTDKEYLKGLRKLCTEKDILLIFDEVQTGICRTGRMFSFENYSVRPDLFTLAKGLGGGVPIGAMLCTAEVNAFTPGDHGTTFGGNPLACAAANYVLDRLIKDNFADTVSQKGNLFLAALENLHARHPQSIIEVRGLGLLIGVALNTKISGKAIVARMLENGYILNCAGGNTLRLAPPFIITDKEIHGLIACLDKILLKEEQTLEA